MRGRFPVGTGLLFFAAVVLLLGAPGSTAANRLAGPLGDDKGSPAPADPHGHEGEDDGDEPYDSDGDDGDEPYDSDGDDGDWDEPAPWPEPPEAEPEYPEPDGLEGAALWTRLADPWGGSPSASR